MNKCNYRCKNDAFMKLCSIAIHWWYKSYMLKNIGFIGQSVGYFALLLWGKNTPKKTWLWNWAEETPNEQHSRTTFGGGRDHVCVDMKTYKIFHNLRSPAYFPKWWQCCFLSIPCHFLQNAIIILVRNTEVSGHCKW